MANNDDNEDNLEDLQRQLDKTERELVYFNLELNQERDSYRRHLLLEQIKLSSQEKLLLIRKIGELNHFYGNNLERALELA
jgi:hypothetical protein